MPPFENKGCPILGGFRRLIILVSSQPDLFIPVYEFENLFPNAVRLDNFYLSALKSSPPLKPRVNSAHEVCGSYFVLFWVVL